MYRPIAISPVLPRVQVGRLLIVCLLLLPVQAHAGQAKRDVKREIEKLEDEWRTAQLSGDISTMDRMLADDYVGITMTGQVTTKVQQLARLRSRTLVITRLDLQDRKVKLAGQVAIVTVKARVEGRSDVRRIDGEYRYTRIYHQLASGAWKITNFEATRLPTGNHHASAPRVQSGQAS